MKAIKVLVIDDSFTMRLLISDILNADPEIIVVGAVNSGKEAINILPSLKPDCITLDLEMPGMDGLATLKTIMRKYPTPVIILSAYSSASAEITYKCLANGAMGFVPKPSGEVSYDIRKVRTKLILEVKKVAKRKLNHLVPQNIRELKPRHWSFNRHGRIIVIGASTGGPQALEALLSEFPADFSVPILVVQHMPEDYLDSFIKRLNLNCWLEVKKAKDKEAIRTGTIYCIPSAFRFTLENINSEIILRLKPDEQFDEHYPVIDSVMNVVSNLYGDKTIGIILTGMGNDGVEGMKQIKLKGGTTIVQDEQALLFGMPKAVIDQGLADYVLTLETIPETLTKIIQI